MEKLVVKSDPNKSDDFYVCNSQGRLHGPYSEAKAYAIAAFLNHLAVLKVVRLENIEEVKWLVEKYEEMLRAIIDGPPPPDDDPINQSLPSH